MRHPSNKPGKETESDSSMHDKDGHDDKDGAGLPTDFAILTSRRPENEEQQIEVHIITQAGERLVLSQRVNYGSSTRLHIWFWQECISDFYCPS